MKVLHFAALVGVVALILLGIDLVPSRLFLHAQAAPVVKHASPFVRVDIGDGHGSAVNIGHGYYLTAGHVADAAKDTDIILVNDHGGKAKAAVLWSNSDYDLALLKADDGFTDSAKLSCAPLTEGEHLIAHGNPLSANFVAMEGHATGKTSKIDHWLSATYVDMTVIPGMSGGGVTDDAGDVVAITVAVQSFGFGGGLTGLGIVVPTEAACLLMDRQA